jgi:hypothetical protein
MAAASGSYARVRNFGSIPALKYDIIMNENWKSFSLTKIYIIKTYISNLVRTTHSWNNLHHVTLNIERYYHHYVKSVKYEMAGDTGMENSNHNLDTCI